MDELTQKVEELLKSLLSIKTGASKDLMVPAIKPPSFKTPAIKQPSVSKLPGGLPPPSKKDPVKVAEQLKNPNPGKAKVEILKIEDNGQWTLSKVDRLPEVIHGQPIGSLASTPTKNVTPSTPDIIHAPINAKTEGFANHHNSEQIKLIHGLDLNAARPMQGGVAGAAHRAVNPVTGKEAVVKKASLHSDKKARGHLDNGFNSAKREVLFHNMAHNFFGMGKHVPTTAGFTHNGEDYSAMEMMPTASHDKLKKQPDDQLDDAEPGENPFQQKPKMNEFADPSHGETLKKLHASGDLHKMALMDNIMGHHDRHANNFMMDKGNKLHLIDNGTAFDYGNFDTAHYPDYLTHAEDPYIKGMGLDNTKVHPKAIKWLNSLDPAKAKELLASHGHDENSPATQGFLRRLQGMKNSVNNGPEHYQNMDNMLDQNRLTTGPLHEHDDMEPQW